MKAYWNCTKEQLEETFGFSGKRINRRRKNERDDEKRQAKTG